MEGLHRYDTVMGIVRRGKDAVVVKGILISYEANNRIKGISNFYILCNSRFYNGEELTGYSARYSDRYETLMERRLTQARIVLFEKSVIGKPVKWNDRLNPDYKEDEDEYYE